MTTGTRQERPASRAALHSVRPWPEPVTDGTLRFTPWDVLADYTYFTTYARIVGSIAAWVGVCLFQECPYPWRAAVPVGCGSLTQNVRQSVMSTWRIRNIFLVSTLLRCAAGIFDVGIVERWNIAAGIPDKCSPTHPKGCQARRMCVALCVVAETNGCPREGPCTFLEMPLFMRCATCSPSCPPLS